MAGVAVELYTTGSAAWRAATHGRRIFCRRRSAAPAHRFAVAQRCGGPRSARCGPATRLVFAALRLAHVRDLERALDGRAAAERGVDPKIEVRLPVVARVRGGRQHEENDRPSASVQAADLIF